MKERSRRAIDEEAEREERKLESGQREKDGEDEDVVSEVFYPLLLPCSSLKWKIDSKNWDSPFIYTHTHTLANQQIKPVFVSLNTPLVLFFLFYSQISV